MTTDTITLPAYRVAELAAAETEAALLREHLEAIEGPYQQALTELEEARRTLANLRAFVYAQCPEP